ncbi:unnamed protein product [Boreogadus saida]
MEEEEGGNKERWRRRREGRRRDGGGGREQGDIEEEEGGNKETWRRREGTRRRGGGGGREQGEMRRREETRGDSEGTDAKRILSSPSLLSSEPLGSLFIHAAKGYRGGRYLLLQHNQKALHLNELNKLNEEIPLVLSLPAGENAHLSAGSGLPVFFR